MRLKVITVVTVILLLVAMSVPVYADTVIPDPPEDAYEYWVYVLKEGTEILFLTRNSPITTPTGRYAGRTYHCGKYYAYKENEWEIRGSDIGYVTFQQSCNIVAANHDIAYSDGSGFFFLRPKVRPLYQTMKTTDFGTILRNFSAGLIPIIGLLILAIALWKGWSFLRNQLMH